MTDAWRADQDEPHDAAHGQAQIDGVLARLGPAPARVLELGCGAGRVLAPIAAAGHHVTGIDRDLEAIAACRAQLPPGAGFRFVPGDFHGEALFVAADGPFDAVLCLGNTFLTVVDVNDAVTLLSRAREALNPEGWLAIDDLPSDLWPELTEGNWQSGLAETGDAQLLWHPSDAVFVLRYGDDVDPAAPDIGPDDSSYRLWTDGALALAARAAGLSAAERDETAHLLVFRAAAVPERPPFGGQR